MVKTRHSCAYTRLQGNSYAPAHSPMRGLHAQDVRAGRGMLRAPADVDLPLEFSGCDMCRTRAGGGFRFGF